MATSNTAAAVSNPGNPAESALPVVQLSAEHERAAQQSLKVYCQPIEYYNILHDRALDKPLYLQRCLRYKVLENRKRRQRSGNVTFNLKCYNDMCQMSEVMEDYSCAICLIKCASFKGLKCHLRSCHDLFHYEFQLDEDYQVVNVFWKTNEFDSFDSFMSEHVFGIHARQSFSEQVREERNFSYRRKPVRSRRSAVDQSQIANHVGQLLVASDMLATLSSDPRGTNAAGAQSAPRSSNLTPSEILLREPPHPTNRTLLQKRRFFHSRGAQPMALEEVLAEKDSDDEADDDVADLEDKRRLNDLAGVTQDKKDFMHLWNSFTRKQRVVADAHIPWACKAFLAVHGKDLVGTPMLTCSWRTFMTKLLNCGLIDVKTLTYCNQIIEDISKN